LTLKGIIRQNSQLGDGLLRVQILLLVSQQLGDGTNARLCADLPSVSDTFAAQC
jgi:hypothetical protein